MFYLSTYTKFCVANCRTRWLRKDINSGMITFGHIKNIDLSTQKYSKTVICNESIKLSKHSKKKHNAAKILGQTVGEIFTKYFKDAMKSLVKSESINYNYDHAGSYSFSKSLELSYNLHNPGHGDLGDTGACMALWLLRGKNGFDKTLNDSDGWYFLLPHASIDGSKGVAIKLYHGLLISWNGNELKHCTMFSNSSHDDKYSIFMGPKQKYGIQEGCKVMKQSALKAKVI